MPATRPPWWMYIVATSYLGFVLLLPYQIFMGPGLPPGLEADFVGGGMRVKSVLRKSFWQQAGLEPGDRVVAIDGQSIRNIHDWQAIRANTEAGRMQHWELMRGDKQALVTLTLPKGLEGAVRVGPFLLGLALLSFLLALLIGFRRPYDPVARWGAWLLATAAFAFGQWDGWAVTWRHLPSVLGALLWIPQISRFVIDGILLTFFVVFPTKLFKSRSPWLLIWIPVLGPLPWRISAMYAVIYQPEHATGGPEWVFTVSLPRSIAYVASALVALAVNYWRLEDINQRRRIRVMAAGMSVSLLAAMAFIFLKSRGFFLGSMWFAPLETALQILVYSFPLAFAYAILRHRLFDIRVMIRQGLQYALARRVLISLLPALGAIAVADMLSHGDQPLIKVLSMHGWGYAGLGGLAFVAYTQRQHWLETLDRHFFREHYDARRLLREIAEEARQAGSLDRAAPRVVARIEAALHPEFAALMVREPREAAYRALAASPAGHAPPPLPAESKLIALARVLDKPLEMPHTESGWLQQQLPHEETDLLRRARIDLLVPIATVPQRREAVLALGIKRSEEPYTREDQDLLVAIAASLALLIERPVEAPARVSEAFEECPQCGVCYDTGAGHCAQEGSSLVPIRLPRQLVGRYRLEQRRGRGGMGTIYEATDMALERRVAVKVIRDDLVGSTEAAERFRREARATASFAHPNVVTVYDFGVAAETRAFLAMELLDGRSLREELRRQKQLTPPRTVEILRGVCAAVDAAHRRKLVHRDLKPENIFLSHTETGEIPKVLDFGIAKFLPADAQATAESRSTGLLGTLPYTAPEQLRGQPVDPAWDLWALAVVTYEMLSGVHPFAGATGADYSALLMGRFTPLAAHLPESPTRWQEFFARTLALEPSRRPGSAMMFFSQLELALS